MSPQAINSADRRAISKELSRLASAGIADILASPGIEANWQAHVIGITGPPGAGKSTLIGRLAAHRIRSIAPAAIVAIDPTSPLSDGSILGDRTRMDALSEDPRVFIRSLPSRSAEDGLTHNLAELVTALDSRGFAEVFVETVGVGQSAYGIRSVADVEVLVLTPGAGDYIQAMKAGIMETADIFVVNKADLPGADAVANDLLGIRRHGSAGPHPPLVQVRLGSELGVVELSEAIDAHLVALAASDTSAARLQLRRKYRLQRLLQRTLLQVIERLPSGSWREPLRDDFIRAVDQLCDDAHSACQQPPRPRAPGSAGTDNGTR